MPRFIELLLVFLLLPLWLPLIAVLAVGVRIVHGRPVFFRQLRPGRNGKLFELIKFRTMRNARGVDGNMLPDAVRLTRFGRWLRSTSLDELPELFNVVRGEMSLVGPRPLLPQYLPLYSTRHQRRHELRPGITGWAQINGRNSVDWPTRLDLDVWYVDNQSFRLDVLILTKTVQKVLGREGISAAGDATMPPFQGYN